MQGIEQSLKLISNYKREISSSAAFGKVCKVVGPIVYARVPGARLGNWAHINMGPTKPDLMAEVVSFNGDLVGLAPFDDIKGLQSDAVVKIFSGLPGVETPISPLGIVIDALGNTLSETKPDSFKYLELEQLAPKATLRKPISKQLETGIRGIDCLCPIGQGQRLGLFAGPGLGKSTLLGMLARSSSADINIIALIGERGREVNEFIESALGPAALNRSILVVATSDESPSRKILATKTALALAEHHRAKGKNVLLLVDSLTRTARAIRDLSLSAGELPIRQGYTSTVYTSLPKLIERTGNSEIGSITAIFTVLSQERQDLDPLAEEVKSLLDGHIVLSNSLAEKGIRPAIDYLSSVSRLTSSLFSDVEQDNRRTLIKTMSKIEKDRDLYILSGSESSELQQLTKNEKLITDFISQSSEQNFRLAESKTEMLSLCSKLPH